MRFLRVALLCFVCSDIRPADLALDLALGVAPLRRHTDLCLICLRRHEPEHSYPRPGLPGVITEHPSLVPAGGSCAQALLSAAPPRPSIGGNFGCREEGFGYGNAVVQEIPQKVR